MHLPHRKAFIKKMMALSAGILAMPKFSFSSLLPDNFKTATAYSEDEKPFKMNEFAIIDLHCHPSQKLYLLGGLLPNKHLWGSHCPEPGPNLTSVQIDLKQLSAGNMRGLMAAHYLPEAGLKTKWEKVKEFEGFLKQAAPNLYNRLEPGGQENFDRVNAMMGQLEYEIGIANKKQNKIQLKVAKNFKEFQQYLKEPNTIALAHAIEGAHAIGRGLPGGIPAYLQNLEALKKRGLALITLGHFFENDFVSPVEGVSPASKTGPGFEWLYNPATDNHPLKRTGEAVVEKMLDLGIVVDLTHSTPECRKGVFKINAGRKAAGKPMRPLIFSHTCSQEVFEKYENKTFDNYKYYCVSPEEIDNICACDGTIGVIPENFWLAGRDAHIKGTNPGPEAFEYGITYIIETIKNINQHTRTKDYDNISFGTDFDGLADDPKDLYVPSQLSDLFAAMKKDGFTDEQIKKISYKNALRVLENAWV